MRGVGRRTAAWDWASGGCIVMLPLTLGGPPVGTRPGVRPLHRDVAVEKGAVFDDQPRHPDSAGHRAGTGDEQALAHGGLTLEGASDGHVACLELGLGASVAFDRDVSAQRGLSLEGAAHSEIALIHEPADQLVARAEIDGRALVPTVA